MRSLPVIIFLFTSFLLPGQLPKFYTLANDSLDLPGRQKLILVYYSDHACFDCFVHLNKRLDADSIKNYYFIIERSGSPMINYDIYTKLVNKGVPKEKVLFTKTQSHTISPFIKIYYMGKTNTIPYSGIFEDKTTLEISGSLVKKMKDD